jgi:hypothetical protein
MRRLLIIPLALLSLSVVSSTASAQKRGDRNTITRQDIDEAGGSITNAWDTVERLRPNWLRPPLGRNSSASLKGDFGRASSNATEATVYIDERRQPNAESLRTIPVRILIEIKYLDQNRGVQMLGPGHEAGAILVTTVNKP